MKITQILDKTHRQLALGVSILFIACLGLAMVAGFFFEILSGVKLPLLLILLAGGALAFIIYKQCVGDSRL